VGVDSRDVIDITDFDTLKKVTVAIIHHENGRVIYPDEIINEGVKRALA
jgi:hypothetical protein